jgi:hypothetical protein
MSTHEGSGSNFRVMPKSRYRLPLWSFRYPLKVVFTPRENDSDALPAFRRSARSGNVACFALEMSFERPDKSVEQQVARGHPRQRRWARRPATPRAASRSASSTVRVTSPMVSASTAVIRRLVMIISCAHRIPANLGNSHDMPPSGVRSTLP